MSLGFTLPINNLYDKVYRPIIKYDVYFSEVCVFSNGHVSSSDIAKRLNDTNSANECAVLVKSERPLAIGATWVSKGPFCYAKFGKPATIVVNKGYTSCLFPGK